MALSTLLLSIACSICISSASSAASAASALSVSTRSLSSVTFALLVLPRSSACSLVAAASFTKSFTSAADTFISAASGRCHTSAAPAFSGDASGAARRECAGSTFFSNTRSGERGRSGEMGRDSSFKATLSLISEPSSNETFRVTRRARARCSIRRALELMTAIALETMIDRATEAIRLWRMASSNSGSLPASGSVMRRFASTASA